MTNDRDIVEILGGEAALSGAPGAQQSLGAMVREGLPAQAVRSLAEHAGTSISFLIDIAGLNRRTMERRLSSDARLKKAESDGIVRIARVIALAQRLLGTDRGLRWLQLPNRALGDKRPIDMLDTEVDARTVEAVLGRIEHGVFS